jgi:hypothetical protein
MTPMAMAILAASNSTGFGNAFVDDLFFTNMRDGTGATASVTNGPNISNRGGLHITKSRSAVTGWRFTDTVRGASKSLESSSTAAAQTEATGVTAFNNNGVSLGADADYNASAQTFIDYFFCKAPKFFDIVTWTGTGANRTIAHNLGIAPGMIFVKRTDSAVNWQVYNVGMANTEYAVLNTTAAKATGATRWNSTTPTSTVFSLGTDASVNASGGTYVAYLFAHDSSATGLIQCGVTVNDASGNSTVNLGFEPQFILTKRVDGTSDWSIADVTRGFTVDGNWQELLTNTASAETSTVGGVYKITSTGFTVTGGWASGSILYMAIRRSNKPPTFGTQVFNAIARTGTGAIATVSGAGFCPDLVIGKARNSATTNDDPNFTDSSRGPTIELLSDDPYFDVTRSNDLTAFTMDGFVLGDGSSGKKNANTTTYIEYCLKRAANVFDIVCDTGTGANHTVPHNLGAVPELIIRKGRTANANWSVYHSALGNNKYVCLNTTGAATTDSTIWNNTTPTVSSFTLGTLGLVNGSASTYVTYLFTSLLRVSKVGSYTGNGGSAGTTGTSFSIGCGFTSGARFVLIKRTDNTGDWFVWDTVRGITSGTDPHIALNKVTAEVSSDDSIHPFSSGFTVNQNAATDLNVTGATYIFLAIA